MQLRLDNKIVLVTGASRGIGQAIAKTLAQAGAYVIGTATSAAGAEAISVYLRDASLQGEGRVLNVSDKASVDAFIKQLESDKGAVEILVNNAGITRDNLLMRMKDSEWEDIMSTNLSSIFYLSKACIRSMMKARWGRIISIGSVIGSRGNPGQANYAAAKAGVVGFSKSLAQEIGSRGITVNVVAPGMIDTDMTRALDDKQKEGILQSIPAGRLGQAQEIANAVCFLASEQAAYITGETLHVNGGMHMI